MSSGHAAVQTFVYWNSQRSTRQM